MLEQPKQDASRLLEWSLNVTLDNALPTLAEPQTWSSLLDLCCEVYANKDKVLQPAAIEDNGQVNLCSFHL
jgi:hypothetical protein